MLEAQASVVGAKLEELIKEMKPKDLFDHPSLSSSRQVILCLLKMTCCVVTMVAATSNGLAQVWQATGAPNKQWLVALACSADGVKLVAAVAGNPGIYCSTNAGQSWLASGAPSNSWTSVASSADGNQLIASAAIIVDPTRGGDHGDLIYISTNSGASWRPTSAQSNQWSSVASSGDGKTLVAAAAYNNRATSRGLIYVSTNSGTNWRASDAPADRWYSVACSADGTRQVAGGTGIFTSTNSGSTWQSNNIAWDFPAGASPMWYSVASSADGSTLLAIRLLTTYSTAGSVDRVYVSTNYGTTWASTDFPRGAGGYVATSGNGDTLIVSMGYIYTSTNSGVTWSQNNVPGQTYGWIASSADGNRLILALSADAFSLPNSIYTRYSPPKPRLKLKAVGSGLGISWTVPATNMVLQRSSSLNAAGWETIADAFTLNPKTLQEQFILSATNGWGFYRLATP